MERSHIPPNQKLGTSSFLKLVFWEGICLRINKCTSSSNLVPKKTHEGMNFASQLFSFFCVHLNVKCGLVNRFFVLVVFNGVVVNCQIRQRTFRSPIQITSLDHLHHDAWPNQNGVGDGGGVTVFVRIFHKQNWKITTTGMFLGVKSERCESLESTFKMIQKCDV